MRGYPRVVEGKTYIADQARRARLQSAAWSSIVVALAGGYGIALSLLAWVCGHTVVYRLLPADAHAADVAGGSGAVDRVHGYLEGLGLVGSVGITVTAVLATALVAHLLRRARMQCDAAPVRFSPMLAGLATCRAQRSTRMMSMLVPAAAFVAMEVHERVAAGLAAPPLRLLVVGAIVQALLGFVVADIASGSVRTGARAVDAVILRLQTTPSVTHERSHATPCSVDVVPRWATSGIVARKLARRGPPVRTAW